VVSLKYPATWIAREKSRIPLFSSIFSASSSLSVDGLPLHHVTKGKWRNGVEPEINILGTWMELRIKLYF
jgi:hypothetical protein